MDKYYKDINDLYLLSMIVQDLERTLEDLTTLNSTTRDGSVKLMVLKSIKIIEKMDIKPLPTVRTNNLID